MATCYRPGCTTEINGVGVCISCANSDWEPKSDGIQLRDSDGTFMTTPGHWD